jgi:hypothetical protein
MIIVRVATFTQYTSAFIMIRDEAGRQLYRVPVKLNPGVNEVEFNHGYHAAGTFFYALVIDGKDFATRKMVIAN